MYRNSNFFQVQIHYNLFKQTKINEILNVAPIANKSSFGGVHCSTKEDVAYKVVRSHVFTGHSHQYYS